MNSMHAEGRIFWVKFESYPPYENMALKHARENFKLALCSRVPYDDVIVIMNRALESIKEEQEMMDLVIDSLVAYVAGETCLPDPQKTCLHDMSQDTSRVVDTCLDKCL